MAKKTDIPVPKKEDQLNKPMEESKYASGWEDDAVKQGLLLIGMNNSDKSARDNQNQMINEILKEASYVMEPTKPKYVGAKKAKQSVQKTAERIQPLEWSLVGDGATEDEEILMTKALKEALHRGGYDSTFTGPGGSIDKLLSYGDSYRLIMQADQDKTSFPVEFTNIDSNNIWMSTSATSFRNGNKNITRLVALFKGTIREFNEEFPQFENAVKPGLIPRAFAYKDLDQTATQKFQAAYAAADESGYAADDNKQVEWAYMFDMSKLTYRLVAGAELSILEAKDGKTGKNKYPWVFENLEGKQEAYIPVSNFICLPAVEGIYHTGLLAYIYDICVVFRRTINQLIGHVEENVWPHTLVNIPQGQEGSFFNLVEMANQMRASGQNAYIPITYNPSNPAGNISNANPIMNGGDVKAAQLLSEVINTELRQCGVYLDEPLNADLTEMQIQLNASNASVLPKAIMKYNAPEIEFEIMVAMDMFKKYIKTGDKTPLILDTTIDLPDGKFSIRGIPFTLGWLKDKLLEKQWRVRIDPVSGAVTDNHALISLYKSILPVMPPGSPQAQAIAEKIALISGVKMANPNPAASQQLSTANGAVPNNPRGLPPPNSIGGPPPVPPLPSPSPGLMAAAGVPAR